MKKILLLSLMLLSINYCFSQTKPYKDLSKSEWNKIKESETIFYYRASDDVSAMKNAITPVWKFTKKLTFKPYTNIDNKKTDASQYNLESLLGKTVISITGYAESSNSTHQHMMDKVRFFPNAVTSKRQQFEESMFLDFWYVMKNKKGKLVRVSLGKRDLSPHIILKNDIPGTEKKTTKRIKEYTLNEAKIYNWHPGFIKHSLIEMQSTTNYWIEHGAIVTKKSGFKVWKDYGGEISKEDANKLSNSVLYIPDYAFSYIYKYCIVYMSKKSRTNNTKKTFLRKYPYKYKVISSHEMDSLLINTKEELFCLIPTVNGRNMSTQVINTQNSESIYQKDNRTFVLDMDKNPMETLTKAIKKAKE